MTKTPAVLCLDIEDPITTRSHYAAEWICQQISEAGLTASCFLVAEKVRAWERLGLSSVIEAVGAHDLAFHSSRHSFHPTITEMSEALPAQAGAELLWAWQQPSSLGPGRRKLVAGSFGYAGPARACPDV